MVKELSIERMLTSIVTVVVGIFLIPVVSDAITDAGITDPTISTLVSLIPLIFALSIVYSMSKGLI